MRLDYTELFDVLNREIERSCERGIRTRDSLPRPNIGRLAVDKLILSGLTSEDIEKMIEKINKRFDYLVSKALGKEIETFAIKQI